jgi:regulatory protein
VSASIRTSSGDDREVRERVRQRALRLLARREHSVEELTKKLVERVEAEEPLVRAVIAELEGRDLVSDERFADAYVRDALRLKPKARRLLVRELVERGVSGVTAARVVDTVFAEDEVDDEVLALRVARAYAPRVSGSRSEAAWRRLAGHMQRRGFSNELIYEVCAEVVPGSEIDG